MTTYMPLIIIVILFLALVFNAVCIVLHKLGMNKQAIGKDVSDETLL